MDWIRQGFPSPFRAELQWLQQTENQENPSGIWTKTFSGVPQSKHCTENSLSAPWQNFGAKWEIWELIKAPQLCSRNQETIWINSFVANSGILSCSVGKSPRSSNFYYLWNLKMCEVFSVLPFQNGKLGYFGFIFYIFFYI